MKAHAASCCPRRAFTHVPSMSLAALSLAMFDGRAAHAQQLIANGTTQTAAAGSVWTGNPAFQALNGGIIDTLGSVTLSPGGGALGAQAQSGGHITLNGGLIQFTPATGNHTGLLADGSGSLITSNGMQISAGQGAEAPTPAQTRPTARPSRSTAARSSLAWLAVAAAI